MEKEGSQNIEIAGKDDRSQITAVFSGTMSRHYVPPQVIYQEKTLSVEFPYDWDITYTEICGQMIIQ